MSSPPPTGPAATIAAERAVAEIDLGAVERNCRRLRSLAGAADLCAVVKAGGYGHGAVECARAARASGADWLAVAAADEAAVLRDRGIGGRLLVMGALTAADARTAAGVAADVVAWDEDFVAELSRAAAEGRRLAVHVKLDTGMGRLGTKEAGAAMRVCRRVADDDRLELVGVMTHFATADEADDRYFQAQLDTFERFVASAKSAHPGLIAHAANSAATYRDRRSHFDLVRCGIAIYGLDPFHEDGARRGLEPALALRSYVAAVKRFRAGESAGYGRRWLAPRDTWVAVLPIGYGDGVRRALSGNCDVLIGGSRRPLVGTVSMDNVTVDLGPETDARPGDPAVLIGPQGGERISCEEVARRMGTINYEVTCGISPRVSRRYRDA